MIAINIWLLIVMYFFVLIIGYMTAWFCGKCKVAEAEMDKNYWKREYFLEKESHKGSIKKYLNKLLEADRTILKLSEEKANLSDSISYYKEYNWLDETDLGYINLMNKYGSDIGLEVKMLKRRQNDGSYNESALYERQ